MANNAKTGQKLGFEPQQVALLRAGLALRRDYRGLALLNIGIDSFLRVSDLVRLRVKDVRKPDGSWRDLFSFGMRKEDGRAVEIKLYPHTHAALAEYVRAYKLNDDDLLFPVSKKTVERMVKAWALEVD